MRLLVILAAATALAACSTVTEPACGAQKVIVNSNDQSIGSDSAWLPKALVVANLVKSSSQGRQLVEQGGVEVDQQRVTDVKLVLAPGTYLVRVGSKNRKFARLVVSQ
jgi:tyrosyl-tRNA synthetase